MLAESHEVSDDQLTHTITLRQGVTFHNGEEMTAADVIASIERWGQIAGVGKGLLEATDEIVEVDDYTIEFNLNTPYGIFVSALAFANGGCAIYPKSVIDASGDGELADFIGTGPYRFVERQADRYIRLERYEDYAALPGDPNGYGGNKRAYVDQMEFVPVPDEAARIAGLQAGDHHYLESISPDQYVIVEDDPNITAEVLPPQGWGIIFLNWESPIMSDLKIRQAFQAALDHEAIAQAGYGEGFYRLDPGLMFEETVWYTTAGEEFYNMNDPELARQLLEESGYDGTPIRWSTTQEYLDHYNRSVVAIQQLEAVGFTVDLIVKDWATVLSEQFEKDKWDVTVTGISFRPDPALLFVMDVCNIAGWWCSEETIDLVDQLRSESDFDTRYALWEQIQSNAYTEIPFIKVADALTVKVRAASMMGLSQQSQIGPILWNAWLEG
jgi:peptide/nickel transport system substrate-binding protein